MLLRVLSLLMCSRGQKRSSAARLSFQTFNRALYQQRTVLFITDHLAIALDIEEVILNILILILTRMDVVSLQKEYDEIHVRLSVLYEADLIMNENKEVSLLKKTLNALIDAHLSMQHLSVKAIGIADTEERAILLTSIGNHISRKVVFDENVKKWLGERDVSQEVIESLLRIPSLYALILHVHEAIDQDEALHPVHEELKPSRNKRWRG